MDRGIKKQTNGFADFDSLFALFLLGKGIHAFSNAPAFSSSLFYWAYTIIKGKGSDDTTCLVWYTLYLVEPVFHLNSSFSPTMIEYLIRSLPCVSSATYTQETGNVLIHHDPTLSLQTLKKSLRQLWVKKKATNSTIFMGKTRTCCACGAMFLANWYIQRSPFSLVVKNAAHWAAVITSVFTSLGVIKDGIMSLIKNRKANADTLTAASIFASLYIGNPGSALVITMMSTISEWLTEYTSEKTKEYIHSVLELDTTYAWKVNEQGIEEKVALDQVQVGDTVVVFTGEKIPVDGIVSRGHGMVDESSITGEYMPKEIGKLNMFMGEASYRMVRSTFL